jgi:hypothetical protein
MFTAKTHILLLLGVAAFVILAGFPVNQNQVVLLRLDRILRTEGTFLNALHDNCQTLHATQDLRLERAFVQQYSRTLNDAAPTACQLTLVESHYERFGLRSYWDIGLRLSTKEGQKIEQSHFDVDFPLPLTFFPVVLFFLGTLLGASFWSLSGMLACYLFLLAGGNFILFTQRAVHTANTLLLTDVTLMGFVVLLFWSTLFRARRPEEHPEKTPRYPVEKFFNRILILLAGIWNPIFYTLMGRVLYPQRNNNPTQLPFLHIQLLVACLSLYVLNIDINNPLAAKASLWASMTLPRYFTYTALIFLVLVLNQTRVKAPQILWHLPHFWKSLVAVIAVEAASFYLHFLAGYPHLVRVGVGLLLGELFSRHKIPVRALYQQFLPGAALLFLASFVSAMSIDIGVIDLAVALWDPKSHPTGYVLFTFFAGIGIGFLTGSFSATFLALFTLMLTAYDIPLVRAALLDGVLAGSLISPFSLYNLVPALQFGIAPHKILRYRMQQLALPIGIGTIIYTVSAVNSVAILRPVTFIFLCLVAFAVYLRKGNWHLSNLRQLFS